MFHDCKEIDIGHVRAIYMDSMPDFKVFQRFQPSPMQLGTFIEWDGDCNDNENVAFVSDLRLEKTLCSPFVFKTAFTRCRQILKTVKNVTDRPPVHTKTAHFLPADFENGRF